MVTKKTATKKTATRKTVAKKTVARKKSPSIGKRELCKAWRLMLENYFNNRDFWEKLKSIDLQYCLWAGADFKARDDGKTPLHIAALYNSNRETIKFLTRVTDVTARDCDGNTALHFAAMNRKGSAEIISILINARADKYAKNDAGKTPYDYLLKNDTFKDYEEAIALLKTTS